MAACLITVSGTSGEVLLKYTQSAIVKKLIAPIGTLYLDDATVSGITYTTLYGDAVAASGCFTITNAPMTCYHFKWDFSNLEDYEAVAIEVDDVSIPLTSTTFPGLNPDGIAEAINSLGDDNLKAVQAKVDTVLRPNFILVVKTIALTPPLIKLSNTSASASLYIKGETGSCTNVGFYDYNTCQPIFLP